MPETVAEAELRKAKAMAWSLNITVYLREDGNIYQHPPGQAIAPPTGAGPELAGRGGLSPEGGNE